jgi:hypothetical protein
VTANRFRHGLRPRRARLVVRGRRRPSGTTLEFIPTVGPFSGKHVALMRDVGGGGRR